MSAIGLTWSVEAKDSFDDDFRVWNEFMVHEYSGANWSTYTWGELRWSDDASELTTWYVQQKIYTMLFPWLQIGGGAAYIRTDTAADGWVTLYRGEYEINPKAKLGDKVSVTLRNRLENRRWETRDYNDEWLSRHRFQLMWKTRWFPGMTKYEAFNEIFYDYRLNQSTENRFRPASVHFKLSDYVSMNLFFQIRSRRENNESTWSEAYIAGTGLRFYPGKL
jgi:hypothetical protein